MKQPLPSDDELSQSIVELVSKLRTAKSAASELAAQLRAHKTELRRRQRVAQSGLKDYPELTRGTKIIVTDEAYQVIGNDPHLSYFKSDFRVGMTVEVTEAYDGRVFFKKPGRMLPDDPHISLPFDVVYRMREALEDKLFIESEDET